MSLPSALLLLIISSSLYLFLPSSHSSFSSIHRPSLYSTVFTSSIYSLLFLSSLYSLYSFLQTFSPIKLGDFYIFLRSLATSWSFVPPVHFPSHLFPISYPSHFSIPVSSHLFTPFPFLMSFFRSIFPLGPSYIFLSFHACIPFFTALFCSHLQHFLHFLFSIPLSLTPFSFAVPLLPSHLLSPVPPHTHTFPSPPSHSPSALTLGPLPWHSPSPLFHFLRHPAGLAIF